ncbi:MAG: hypothetical protein ACRDPM_10945 [Solirubrobacteraceae bacterium]
MLGVLRDERAGRRTRTGGLLALGAACLLAAVAPAAMARRLTHKVSQHLTYKVLYDVSDGHYRSSFNGGATSHNETTTFFARAVYKNLRIPARGPASSTINLKTELISVIGDWEAFGNGLDSHQDVVPFDCKSDALFADTDKDGPAHILSDAGSARTALHLDIQATPQVEVSGATGSDPAAQDGCSSFDGEAAFSPVAFELMPDMLTAQVSIPLAKLRAATRRRGDVWGVSFTDSHALAHAPDDCGGLDGSCSMHWKARLKLTRTG